MTDKTLLLLTFGILSTVFAQDDSLMPRKYSCQNGIKISNSKFCNGYQECGDKSDEISNIDASFFNAFAEHQRCDNARNDYNGSCLAHRDLICNEEILCSNLTPCDLKCDTHYICQNSGKCVLRTTVCNQNKCDGCPEDHEWNNGVGFKCRINGKACVLPQQLLHDDVSDCDGGADLCFGLKYTLNETSRYTFQDQDNIFTDKCFACLTHATIIPASHVCNGIIDCPDLSDECPCIQRRPEICQAVITLPETRVQKSTDIGSAQNALGKQTFNNYTNCEVGRVKCKSGKCISRESVCDGIRDCDDDEMFGFCQGTIPCGKARGYERTCRCDPHVPTCVNSYASACNNKGDCPTAANINGGMDSSSVFTQDECEAFCGNVSTHNYICSQLTSYNGDDDYSKYPCKKHAASSNNQTAIVEIDIGAYCDGNLDCMDGGDDERNCPRRFKCDPKVGRLISITMDQTCDGTEDCKDGSDEWEILCNQTRFRCPYLGGKKVSIDNNLVCDYRITCDDASDEKNCDDGRFYCESGSPLFVPESMKFDGHGDCSDFSDECPMSGELNSTIASLDEMIGNPFLRALIWIMGFLSIFGNITVLYREGRKLKSKANPSTITFANGLLVINLASADILMGIYLICLGFAGFNMQGEYCSQSLFWRSSPNCVTLGVMTVISSETSVITLALLTGCRTYAVFCPFKVTEQPRKIYVFLMILISWTMGFLIALIPLSQHLSGTFVTHAQLEYSPYSTNIFVRLDDARSLFDRLLTYDLKPNFTIPDNFVTDSLSWVEMKKLAKEMFTNSRFDMTNELGYYSADSVCIPKFFLTKSTPAWVYSFTINLFNFFCFLFVASAYTAIYIKASKRPDRLHSEDKKMHVMHRRILRFVITDFCCWMPICIMGFSKLAGAEVSEKAYAFAAIVLLPINSALNPLLYSDLPDALVRKVKKLFSRKSREDIPPGQRDEA